MLVRSAKPFLKLVASLALVVTLPLGLVACSKPKAGAKCSKEGETKCTDKANALVCTDGKWEALPCRANTGCMGMAIGPHNCTSLDALEGEPCPSDEGKWQCSPDKKMLLECQGKHWKKKDDCRGQNGCVVNASGYKCDKGEGNEGDACTADNEGNAACAPDKKALLVCKGGKLTKTQLCKGRHGCRQMGPKIQCDSSTADLGDPCEDGRSEAACTADKKAMLECKGGKYQKSRDCKQQCTVFLDHIECK